MKLVNRLTAIGAGGLLAVALAGGAGLALMQSAVHGYRADVARANAQAIDLGRLRSLYQTQVQEWKNSLLRGSEAKALDKHWRSFEKHEHEVADGGRRLARALPEGLARQRLQAFVSAHAEMGRGYRAGLDKFRHAGFAPAAGDAAVQGLDRAPNQLLAEAITQLERDAAAAAATADATASRALGLALALMLGLTLAGGALTALALRRAMRRLDHTVAAMSRVAEGDLSQPVPVAGSDELTQLARGLAAMQQSLSRLVAEVRRNAESVASASTQIAQGNLDLSTRTEQQSGALQQAASTMEELGTTVRHNADRSQDAEGRARAAAEVAERGGAAVRDVVQTMEGIHQSSQRIEHIIGTIDGIAFQTNILALNAAVEAARAGEQGRGFAVVAGEVRSLAQRSATAAREIKGLIAASSGQVQAGSQRADQAGRTLHEVVEAVRQVSAIVAGIASANQQQSAGVTQMGEVV
ncbi:MAG: HAMP domain-containing protein, partial [Burkholderiaceae bacterium]|nr:HAMP domain-containing protein [Burkholderiaceae bacterium]